MQTQLFIRKQEVSRFEKYTDFRSLQALSKHIKYMTPSYVSNIKYNLSSHHLAEARALIDE